MSKYRGEISQEEFERIERYLLGGMDAAEHAAFEHSLSTDETLRNEVELQRRLMSAVEVGTFKAIGITGREEQATPMIRRSPAFYWRYVAAAVLIIGLGLVGWWFYDQQTVSKDDLFAAYFRPDAGLPVVMSNDSSKYAFNEGMVSYKEGSYDDAINIWKQQVAEKGVTDTLHYYIGVAYLNMDNHAEASGFLVPIADNERSVFREKAIWYLALMKLKEEDYVYARRLLMQLPEHEEAAELLGRMAE